MAALFAACSPVALVNWPGGHGWQKAWPGAGLKNPGRQGVLQRRNGRTWMPSVSAASCFKASQHAVCPPTGHARNLVGCFRSHQLAAPGALRRVSKPGGQLHMGEHMACSRRSLQTCSGIVVDELGFKHTPKQLTWCSGCPTVPRKCLWGTACTTWRRCHSSPRRPRTAGCRHGRCSGTKDAGWTSTTPHNHQSSWLKASTSHGTTSVPHAVPSLTTSWWPSHWKTCWPGTRCSVVLHSRPHTPRAGCSVG